MQNDLGFVVSGRPLGRVLGTMCRLLSSVVSNACIFAKSDVAGGRRSYALPLQRFGRNI